MRRRSGTTRSNRLGFTLVELLVVIVIMLIVAAVVVPVAVDTASTQAVSAARMVVADLQYAQNLAITKQMQITLTFDPNADSYSLTDPNGDTLTHPINRAAYSIDFPSLGGFGRVEVVTAAFGGLPSVTFDELGAPTDPGTVRLMAGSHVYDVAVSAATGKVTVTAVGS